MPISEKLGQDLTQTWRKNYHSIEMLVSSRAPQRFDFDLWIRRLATGRSPELLASSAISAYVAPALPLDAGSARGEAIEISAKNSRFRDREVDQVSVLPVSAGGCEVMALGARRHQQAASGGAKSATPLPAQTSHIKNIVLDKAAKLRSVRLGGYMNEIANQFGHYAKVLLTWGVFPAVLAIAIFYATQPDQHNRSPASPARTPSQSQTPRP